MDVLLLRPVPGNERFGLGPFFRIEPLGMEYIAAALERRGHRVTLADLRFSRPLAHYIRSVRPRLVGIAGMHALETDAVTALAAEVRRLSPDAFLLVGGHTAAAYPKPFLTGDVDAVCVDDGERTVPLLVEALDRGRPIDEVPGLLVWRDGEGAVQTPGETGVVALDEVPLPARHHVKPWRSRYACLAHRPTWLVETARGCPFRCSFCSIWQLHDRSVRERGIGHVCDDFASVGGHVFVADDLFWHHASRSEALVRELLRRGIRKEWVLVQSRVDLVARHPALLEAWRPFAREFDIFFGLEAATNEGLKGLVKDTTVDRTGEAIEIARSLGFGVTGNFVIDPAWGEADFERLWAFVERYELWQAGFTLLTPLPGTAYYEQMLPQLRATEWAQFDMHHLLWEPALGAQRFYELYCETWRRSVLNLSGRKKWHQWLRQVKLRDALFLARMLRSTQRMMKPEAYLAEHRLSEPGAWAARMEPRRSPASAAAPALEPAHAG
ncbi:MAG TPA: radical SAM protein [Vicinamibacterales bacterium]